MKKKSIVSLMVMVLVVFSSMVVIGSDEVEFNSVSDVATSNINVTTKDTSSTFFITGEFTGTEDIRIVVPSFLQIKDTKDLLTKNGTKLATKEINNGVIDILFTDEAKNFENVEGGFTLSFTKLKSTEEDGKIVITVNGKPQIADYSPVKEYEDFKGDKDQIKEQLYKSASANGDEILWTVRIGLSPDRDTLTGKLLDELGDGLGEIYNIRLRKGKTNYKTMGNDGILYSADSLGVIPINIAPDESMIIWYNTKVKDPNLEEYTNKITLGELESVATIKTTSSSWIDGDRIQDIVPPLVDDIPKEEPKEEDVIDYPIVDQGIPISPTPPVPAPKDEEDFVLIPNDDDSVVEREVDEEEIVEDNENMDEDDFIKEENKEDNSSKEEVRIKLDEDKKNESQEVNEEENKEKQNKLPATGQSRNVAIFVIGVTLLIYGIALKRRG